jgi:hypothetical protein
MKGNRLRRVIDAQGSLRCAFVGDPARTVGPRPIL